MTPTRGTLSLLLIFTALGISPAAFAAKVTVQITGGGDVTFVGAINRWDGDGNARKPLDPKAAIDAPEVDAKANDRGGGRWVFANLEPGNYDLVILAQKRVRVEGWTYPPVLEFDPFYPPDSKMDDEIVQAITEDIGKARHYENKVRPLYVGGDAATQKTARVLVMLLRDLPTSYESEFPGAATLRFEVWQYDWLYGGWAKNKRTKVLARVMLHRDELRRWTWLWDARLGGVTVARSPVTVRYAMPKPSDASLAGLRPY